MATVPEPVSIESVLAQIDTTARPDSAILAAARLALPYRGIRDAFDTRLDAALSARRAERHTAAESLRSSAVDAARAAHLLYETRALLREEEWSRGLSGEEIAARIVADSLLGRSEALREPLERATAWQAAVTADSIFTRIGDRRGILLAETAVARSDPEGNRDLLRRRSSEMASALLPDDELLTRARMLRNVWVMAREFGHSEEMDTALAEHGTIAERTNDDQGRMEVGLGQGERHEAAGHPSEARASYQRSLDAASRLGQPRFAGMILQRLGNLAYEAGNFDSCAVLLERASRAFAEAGSEHGVAQCGYGIGLARWYQGRLEEALRHLEEAHEQAARGGMTDVEGVCVNLIANIHLDLGNYDRARSGYERALELAIASGDRELEGYCHSNLGRVYLEADSLTLARDRILRALELAQSAPSGSTDWDQLGGCLDYLARIAAKRGEMEEAERYWRRGYDLARDSTASAYNRHVGITRVGPFLGWRLLGTNRSGEAEEVFRAVLESAEAMERPWSAAYAHESLGAIAFARGDSSLGWLEVETAIGVLEGHREALGSLGRREQWFRSALGPFETMISLSIRSGRDAQAFDYFERMKSRELLDLLAGGRVLEIEVLGAQEREQERALLSRIDRLNRRVRGGEEALRDSVRAAREAHSEFEERLFRSDPGLRERRGRGVPIRFAEARSLLSRDEAALLYTLGSSEISVLVLTENSIDGRLLDVEAPEVRDLIERLTTSLRRPEFEYDLHAATRLYEILVTPVEEHLTTRRRLCFVPDDELYSIPWSALVDPSSGGFLSERWTTYVAPSMSALSSLREKEREDRSTILAIGAPVFQTEHTEIAEVVRGSLSPLPGAARELAELATVYGSRQTTVTGALATEDAFVTLAPGHGIVHVASHAFFDDANALASSIALTPSSDDSLRGDGFLEAREILGLRLNADLVVLSACETARGEVTTGEGLNGLLRAFFAAGVPSVVGSLWPVSDESTARLMTEFHREVARGTELADALRAAALATRGVQGTATDARGLGPAVIHPAARDTPPLPAESRPHPFYWAGFSLYGLPD